MGTEKKNITLTIRGRKYPLRTEADSQRLEQVVELVNLRLGECDADSRAGVTDIRLVMLALLNVADECLTHRQSLGAIKERSDSVSAEISLLLHEEVGPLELCEVI
ncbi:cell division protein ZapA [bacterium]|nr:cell division protein ZapA [bacterium]